MYLVAAELIYANRLTDRQTGRQAERRADMTKLIGTFATMRRLLQIRKKDTKYEGRTEERNTYGNRKEKQFDRNKKN